MFSQVNERFDIDDEQNIEKFLAGDQNIQVGLVQSKISRKEVKKLSNGAIRGTVPKRDHHYLFDGKEMVIPMFDPFINVPRNRFKGHYISRFTLEHIVSPHNFYDIKFKNIGENNSQFSQNDCEKIKNYLVISPDWTPELLESYNMSAGDLINIDIRYFQTHVNLSSLDGLEKNIAHFDYFKMATAEARKIAVTELFEDRKKDRKNCSSKAYFFWAENYDPTTHDVDLNVGVMDLGIPEYVQ